MAYLTKEEMSTHLYAENIEVITRGDDTMTEAAIDAAISEAKSYLNGYDRAAIFEATGDARNTLLLTFVKDMAAWHLINLSNAGTEYTHRENRYNRAVNWLKELQKGNVSPDLPTLENEDGVDDSATIRFGSNEKREQKF
jgi:phage gp36-like protein